MSTQEKLEEKIFNLVYQWGRVGIVTDHTAPTYVAYIQELIDSAKREGAEEERKKWNTAAEEALSILKETTKYVERTTAQLEQSEESE